MPDLIATGESHSSKAKAQLGWQPSVDFKGLVTMMVDADLKRYGV